MEITGSGGVRRSHRRVSPDEPPDDSTIGKCKKCSVDVLDTEKAIKCGGCNSLFHIKCGGVDEIHYLLFANNNLHESGFSWDCEECKVIKGDYIKQTSQLNEEIKSIRRDIVEIKSTLPEMTQLIKGKTGKLTEDKPTHNSIVKHSVLIQPKDTTQTSFTNEAWAEVVKTSLSKKLNNVPVEKTVLTNSGIGYMVFPDKNTRDMAVENLKNDCTVTAQDKNTKTLYPKIKISGIPKNLYNKDNTDELRNELMLKNKFLKELIDKDKVFHILFLMDNKDSNFSSAVVKVDPTIKEVILNHGSRLFLGLSTCRVTERYHIVQCYTCQQFGHKMDSDKCQLKNSNSCICLYCAGNHLSRDCPVKKNVSRHMCSNCKNSKKF